MRKRVGEEISVNAEHLAGCKKTVKAPIKGIKSKLEGDGMERGGGEKFVKCYKLGFIRYFSPVFARGKF
jgi:hypothetical protein